MGGRIAKSLAEERDALAKKCDELFARLERERNKKTVAFGRPRSGKSRRGFCRVTFGDTHGMRVDREAFAAFAEDVRTIAPAEIICMGDHVDCDGHLTTHKPVGYTSLSEYSYEEDCGAAGEMLDVLAKAAPQVKRFEYLEGNHEARVRTWCRDNAKNERDQRMNDRLYLPSSVLQLDKRNIEFHAAHGQHDGLGMRGAIKRGKCFFVHGFSHAKRAAENHLQAVAANIVFGHTHRAEEYRTSTETTGTIGAWNPGCLCERHPMWQHSKPTGWTHGFGLQFVDNSGSFLHVNVPIIGGVSLLGPLLKVIGATK